MRIDRSLLGVLGVATILLAGGCVVTDEITHTLFDTRTINLTENTYAAGDVLAQQTRAFMTPMTPMKMTVISDVTAPMEITPFGQQIANQIGSRFVQLGYNVQSMPQPPGTISLSSAPVALENSGAPRPKQMGMKPASGGEVMLTGTYTRGKRDILVSLRVVQSPDQRVIAAYDYTLPLTAELREMTMTAAERERRDKTPFGSFIGGGNAPAPEPASAMPLATPAAP